MSNNVILDLVMSFYIDEPCRICGKSINKDDLQNLVWAGYSKNNESRSAHGECWNKNIPQNEWFYPEDSEKSSPATATATARRGDGR